MRSCKAAAMNTETLQKQGLELTCTFELPHRTRVAGVSRGRVDDPLRRASLDRRNADADGQLQELLEVERLGVGGGSVHQTLLQDALSVGRWQK